MPENIERPKGLTSAKDILGYLKTLAEMPPEELGQAISEMNPDDREHIKKLLPVLKDILEKEEPSV